LRQANLVLKNGTALGMFPEGKRSTSGCLSAALQGSALVGYHNRALIIPIGITGTEQIRGYGWILRRPSVELRIGKPFYLPDIGYSLTKIQLTELTDIIMKRIAELLPEKYQGQYYEECYEKDKDI
jgi:1-acyl-sn-glycerol-3-phosphate acyltransferase